MIPLDQLELFALKEAPDLWEDLIIAEQERAEHDPLAAAILESTYWNRNRDEAFNRFLKSFDFFNIQQLLAMFGISKDSSLVEIGGGSGFLAWALVQVGFSNVSLLEPNSHPVTGTGYLRSRADAQSIVVENSLEEWYQSPKKYQTVLTRNCIHHFPNTTFAAASIRQKLQPNGFWAVFREPYVESAEELYRFLHTHPYSQRYGVFEFGFPASHFVRSLELAGFRLRAVVPEGYANNCLSLYQTEPGNRLNRAFTSGTRFMLRNFSTGSVLCYRIEQALRTLWRTRKAFFSRPQVMLFQRRELGNLPPDAIWYPQEKL